MTPSINITNIDQTFAIDISEGALLARKDALELGNSIVAVSTPAELADAVAAASLINGLIKQMEETREAVKRPILDAGKLIDKTAHGYNDALKLEQARVEKLASNYQADQLRRIEELRQDELRKLAAEALTDKSEDAMLARAERQIELQQPIRVAGATVKQSNDYEVTDLRALYLARPDLAEVTPRRALILASINIDGAPAIPGLRVFQTTKVQAKI